MNKFMLFGQESNLTFKPQIRKNPPEKVTVMLYAVQNLFTDMFICFNILPRRSKYST